MFFCRGPFSKWCDLDFGAPTLVGTPKANWATHSSERPGTHEAGGPTLDDDRHHRALRLASEGQGTSTSTSPVLTGKPLQL